MIFIPTRGRPQSIVRFMEAYAKTGAEAPVLLITDHDDASYDALTLHPNFSRMVMPAHGGIAECANAAFARYPEAEYYATLADDVVPQTPGWDAKLIAACLPMGIAWGDDEVADINLPTHPFFSGALMRRIGWLSCPVLKHWYVDNMTLDIANALGCGKFLREVKLTHFHVLNGKAELDDTYLNQPSRERDRENYIAFRNDQLPTLIERLKAA